MSMLGVDTKVGTVTDNYIDVKFEYFGLPDEDGLRLRTTDVWFATRPSNPRYAVVAPDDSVLTGKESVLETAWTIDKAGMDRILIVDRDDINGLRALLDELEKDFDRRDMEELHREHAKDLDSSDEV